MWIQQVNHTDCERVWINITNGEALTLSAHWPVFKFHSAVNVASVSVNQGGTNGGTGTAVELAGDQGALLGLAYEDIAPGETGAVQCYGYHESFLVMRIVGSVTVCPGTPVGPGVGTASVGLSSSGYLMGIFGPVVALDTITATLHSLGVVGTNYANHCFIRCM